MGYKVHRNTHAMLWLSQGSSKPQSFKDGSGPEEFLELESLTPRTKGSAGEKKQF
jgi:hypothetical protein